MRVMRLMTTALVMGAVAACLLVTGAGAASSDSGMTHMSHQGSAMTKADLRVTLDNLFGEHAVLAMNATNAGVSGSKSFAADAKALDANSVALSKAIGSFYGAKAASTFLNGKFMVPIRANRQPAFGVYRGAGADARPFAINVVEIRSGNVAEMHFFKYPELFPAFGLPDTLR